MYAIYFYENKTYVLNRASRSIPSADDQVVIKGRKAKVVSVLQVKENVYHVFIEFEKIVEKRKNAPHDFRMKRRR